MSEPSEGERLVTEWFGSVESLSDWDDVEALDALSAKIDAALRSEQHDTALAAADAFSGEIDGLGPLETVEMIAKIKAKRAALPSLSKTTGVSPEECEGQAETSHIEARLALEGNPVFQELRLDRDVWKEQAESVERDIRITLWLRHGCDPGALYGDDGEMQCGNCVIDFKRDPIERIVDGIRMKHVGLGASARP